MHKPPQASGWVSPKMSPYVTQVMQDGLYPPLPAIIYPWPCSSAHRYLALYAYKPQKNDELELRKGEMYRVLEKCQDGWFKGTSLRTGLSGVFPGNYVTPVSR